MSGGVSGGRRRRRLGGAKGEKKGLLFLLGPSERRRGWMKCATDCVQVHTPHIHGLTDRTGPRATDNQELVADQVAIRTVLSVLLSFLLQQFAEKTKTNNIRRVV